MTEQQTKAVNPPLRVLIVEDSGDVAEMLSLVLQMRGYQTRVADCGQVALAEAERWQPQVVVLDIGLPEMDGYETARRLLERPTTTEAPAPRLIALTGRSQEEDRRLGREAGFDEFLVKPVDPEDLIRVLWPSGAAGGESPVSEPC